MPLCVLLRREDLLQMWASTIPLSGSGSRGFLEGQSEQGAHGCVDKTNPGIGSRPLSQMVGVASKNSKLRWVMVAHAFNPRTQEAEADRSLESLEFQVSQCYTGKLCLKRKKKIQNWGHNESQSSWRNINLTEAFVSLCFLTGCNVTSCLVLLRPPLEPLSVSHIPHDDGPNIFNCEPR